MQGTAAITVSSHSHTGHLALTGPSIRSASRPDLSPSGVSGHVSVPTKASRTPPDTPHPHTIQPEEVLDVRPREQVLQNLGRVVHGAPGVSRPGLRDHGGHERAESVQVSVGQPLEDTGLRLQAAKRRRGVSYGSAFKQQEEVSPGRFSNLS